MSGAGLAGGEGGVERLRDLLSTALDALAGGTAARGGPLPAGGPDVVRERVREALEGQRARDDRRVREAQVPESVQGGGGGSGRWAFPADGIGAHAALSALTAMLAWGTADPADPACAAHLHCPPLAVAAAADMVVSALNPSLDSWDQAPAATVLETEVIAALAGLVGFDPAVAGGSVTTGGTASNLTALMLAREQSRGSLEGQRGAGVPVRVFCSSAAHFSITRVAALLGLGANAVVPVATDTMHRMDPWALREAVSRRVPGAGRDGHRGAAIIVATAGTTDLGAVDPLRTIAQVAGEYGAWLHIDAAYGGGALLSDRLTPLLDGIAEADSVALDLHKLGWQPIAAGIILTRDARAWAVLEREVAYLNPADDAAAGYPSLLARSLRTSRRSDAFAIAVTMRALGRSGLGRLVDACHDLACHAAERIAGESRLELAAPVVLTTVVFRYVPHAGGRAGTGAAHGGDVDGLNARLRRRLLKSGRAVVGRTQFGPNRSLYLKLTLLNPSATPGDVDALLDAVIEAGDAEQCS